MLLDDDGGAAAASAIVEGARGVLSRDSEHDDLRAAIEAVAHGFTVVTPELVPLLAAPRAQRARADGSIGELSAREREVLTLLGRGLANKSIAVRLSISEHTVKFHVGSILAKLRASSRTEAVATGVRLGLIML